MRRQSSQEMLGATDSCFQKVNIMLIQNYEAYLGILIWNLSTSTPILSTQMGVRHVETDKQLAESVVGNLFQTWIDVPCRQGPAFLGSVTECWEQTFISWSHHLPSVEFTAK